MIADATRLGILVSVLGAAGTVLYLRHIYRRPTRGPLERRIVFVLGCLATFLPLQAVYWWTAEPALYAVAMIPATLVPLAALLLAEGLRRRHAPPAAKWLVAIGTVAAFAGNLVLAAGGRRFGVWFAWFTILTLAGVAIWLALRSRSELSPMENRLADSITIAILVAALFAMTDFGLGPRWLPYKVGGIGALAFVFACVRLTDAREKGHQPARDIAFILGAALAIGFAFRFIAPVAGAALGLAVGLMALAIILLAAIVVRIRTLRRQSTSEQSFARWLLFANTQSLEAFLDSLSSLPWVTRPLVLRGQDLTAYDTDAIARLFDDSHPIWRRTALRSALEQGLAANIDGAEQLVDLLETHEMTHVAMLSRVPPVLLLLNLPELAGSQSGSVEVGLLQKYSRLLPSREPSNA